MVLSVLRSTPSLAAGCPDGLTQVPRDPDGATMSEVPQRAVNEHAPEGGDAVPVFFLSDILDGNSFFYRIGRVLEIANPPLLSTYSSDSYSFKP